MKTYISLYTGLTFLFLLSSITYNSPGISRESLSGNSVPLLPHRRPSEFLSYPSHFFIQMSLSPSTSRYFMLKHYNTDESKEYVSSSFETHYSVLVGSVWIINAYIQTVFLGAGGGSRRANGPTLFWANVLLLDIFEGRVVGILMVENWEVKLWANQTSQKSYQGFWKFPKWLKIY